MTGRETDIFMAGSCMNRLGKDAPEVRVGRIKYLNVAPVYYNMDRQAGPDDPVWVNGTPAELNRLLAEGAIDISPVSSAAYAVHHRDWQILPDLSISSFGNVMSVLLVSRLPLHRLQGEPVCITDESASAAALAKLICSHRGITPRWITAGIEDPGNLDPGVAAFLVIGDKALRNDWSRRFPFIWDLGGMWRRMTGLPFVFALWAVRRQFALDHPDIVSAIGAALVRSKNQGIRHIDQVVCCVARATGLDSTFLDTYYRRLRYDLDPFKKLGLRHFYNCLAHQGLLQEPVHLSFAQSCPAKVIYLSRRERPLPSKANSGPLGGGIKPFSAALAKSRRMAFSPSPPTSMEKSLTYREMC